MTVTSFKDGHSGGGTKMAVEVVIIEAPEDEAVSVFYSRYGRNPYRITCTCCGPDYSVEEWDTLDEAIEFWHGFCNYECIVIPDGQIEEIEKHLSVPVQGWTYN